MKGASFSATMATAPRASRVVDLLDAGLAVDAEAELGLALGDAVLLGRARHGAGVERHADRAGAGDDALGGGGDGGEVGAVLGQRAGDLVDEEGAGDAARPAAVSGSATSSSTMTTRTLRPKARARSAARPKFSRSPV